jgi:hypothetical protein
MGRGLPDGPWKGPAEPPDSGGRRLSRPLPRGVKPGLFFRTATPRGRLVRRPEGLRRAATLAHQSHRSQRPHSPAVSQEPTAASGHQSQRSRRPHRASSHIDHALPPPAQEPADHAHRASSSGISSVPAARPSLLCLNWYTQRPIPPREITQSRNKVRSQHQQSPALSERASGTPSA